ncbi:Thioredoxin-related transmembrane protein 1 [Dirofilaria immitis]|nr:Thioredoxin-related transmembrane protein 1 [Dirofilaria immitis]
MLMKAVIFLIISLISICQSASRNLITLTEDTWTDILKGEWMVEFYAPWCPACKDLQKAWHAFADWSKDLNINVAEVDVTINPGLSGRFLVTALPTIYHVKDGVFRAYVGSRDKMILLIISRKRNGHFTIQFQVINIQVHRSMVLPYCVGSFKRFVDGMTVVAWFFKLSMFVRDKHNYLVEEVGIPSWASYSVFAGITLTLGCILGFFIVCIIDRVFLLVISSASRKSRNRQKRSKSKSQKDESTDESVRNRKGTKNEVKKKK